jgi:Xaa-Pro dipeptidase
MLSRRDFLSTVAASTGATLAVGSEHTYAQTKATPPPSIAALTPMTGEARPITVAERQTRIERACALMVRHRLDAVLLAGGTSTVYFADVNWWISERFFGIFLTAKGDHFVVCPRFEELRAEEQLGGGPLKGVPVLTWDEDEDPYALAAKGLKDRGMAAGRVGVEETVRFVFSNGLAKAAPAVAWVSGTPVTAGCRMVKDAHEIELMRLASRVTFKAFTAAWQALEEGMTQTDFSGLVAAAHARLGFQGGAGVQVGEYSALPHGSLTPQVIREGTILLIDGGCSVEGYRSDLSRTFVLGKPTDKMKAVFDVVHRAEAAAAKAARPGLPCETVDAAARSVIEAAGYGPGYTYFTHRTGHGLGMDGHEWTNVVKGNATPMAAGMVFSDEPGIYIRGEFGVRLEDDLLITATGAELLSPQSPSLEDPFGVGR